MYRIEDIINKVHNADCLEFMKGIPENSIDLIVTDPPYGYSFMGKSWDKALPSVDIWKECLRVLKHGAFAFIMSAPRSDVLSRMIVRIEDAGFRVNFSPIYWTYASGFPKAMNIGKMVDKRAGAERGRVKSATLNAWRESEGRTDRPSGTTPDDNPITDEAKALEGSYGGFQPKPAVEVIIVAMKPLSEKTFVDQALKNGKGVTWLDDCRVPTSEDLSGNFKPGGKYAADETIYKLGTKTLDTRQDSRGRFPANLLVSDDVLNDGKVKKGNGKSYNYSGKEYKVDGFVPENKPQADSNFGDSGSYSRYFDLDAWWAKTYPFLIVPKASKSEKDDGLEDLPEHQIVSMATANGTSGKPSSITEGRDTRRRNNHPTTKPLKLMSYLITLGSRTDDIVLDPFAGSGTTPLAAHFLKRKYIGIEREKEYCDIARGRLKQRQDVLL